MTRLLPALLFTALLACSTPGMAQDDHFEKLEVSLVTIGPGQTYWERFGHNAILVRDRSASDDPGVMYNYGLFDFRQKNFLLNFLRGHMSYTMAAFYADQDLAAFIDADRDITIQALRLTSDQKQQLITFLEWNRKPENAAYRYDYFNNNCSTRVRDVLDTSLDGLLKARFSEQAGTGTLRAHVQRLTSPELALYLGTGLGLGQPVDTVISRWDEFFLPMELQRGLDEMLLADGTRLVSASTILHRSIHPESMLAPNWLSRFILAGLLLACVVGLSAVRAPLGRRVVGCWYLFCGLTGLLLSLLWLFTDHQAAWFNENLLLFSPLCLLAAGPLLFGRNTGLVRVSAALVTTLALASLTLKASPWFYQDNHAFIALALPIHLVSLGLLLRDHTNDTGQERRQRQQ